MTDRGDLSVGDLAILLACASMAPVDKYFALARRRVQGFDRGARAAAGGALWYPYAFYDPQMIVRLATNLRFFHNFMLREAPRKGLKPGERRTPAIKIGLAKGAVYPTDLISFGR